MNPKDLDSETRSKLIEKIKNLLALGDKSRNPNENEANVAARKAQELLHQYNLQMADIMSAEDIENVGDGLTDIVAHKTGRSTLSSWEQRLLALTGEACDVFPFLLHVHDNKTGKLKWHFKFIGLPHEVAIAKELFKYWHSTLKNKAETLYSSSRSRTCFYEGAFRRLRDRVREQNFKKQTNGKLELILANKKDAIEKRKEELNLDPPNQRAKRLFDFEGATDSGIEVADELDLNLNKKISSDTCNR